jgi:hypothetical protein
MLNFTHEDDIKIKNKHVAGISRAFFICPQKPSAGLPNLMRLSLYPRYLGFNLLTRVGIHKEGRTLLVPFSS